MISAVILAAGQSRRMGHPKMLLPWGQGTVIEQVIQVFLKADIREIVVVTGGAREQVEGILERHAVRSVHNPDYAKGEMLSSLQCGLRALPDHVEAALVGLGDQPQIQEGTIRAICAAYPETGSPLVVPSFRMRRGHPWLVARPLWADLLALRHPESPRQFLQRHAGEIQYVNVETDSILDDLDTPEDYHRARP